MFDLFHMASGNQKHCFGFEAAAQYQPFCGCGLAFRFCVCYLLLGDVYKGIHKHTFCDCPLLAVSLRLHALPVHCVLKLNSTNPAAAHVQGPWLCHEGPCMPSRLLIVCSCMSVPPI